MKKTIDQIIEESLNKESIFPIDSPAPGNKVLSVPYPGESKEDKDDEDENLEFSEASKLYVEGKISERQLIKFLVENKNILITEGINPVKYTKFVISFLKGLKVIKRFKSLAEPIMLKAYNCATIACQKAMTPQIVRGLKMASEVIPNPQEKEMVQVLIDRLTTLV